MGEKQKVKKSKRVINEDNTPASWGDVYHIASLVDGIVSNVASVTLYVKENEKLKPNLDDGMRDHIKVIADNILNAKNELVAVMSSLPGKETDTVKEEDFATYLLKYSQVIDIKDRIMEKAFEPYIEMTIGAIDIVDKLESETNQTAPAITEGTV